IPDESQLGEGTNVIEECVEELISKGVKSEDAYIKCKILISVPKVPTTVNATEAQKIDEEKSKCAEIENKIKYLKSEYEKAEKEKKESVMKDIMKQIEELRKSLEECYGKVTSTVAEKIEVKEIIPERMSECARIEAEISNLKKAYEKANETGKKEISEKISYYTEKLKGCLEVSTTPTSVETVAQVKKTVEECVKNLIEKGMNEIEAKATCAPTQAATQTAIIEKCKEIEKEIMEIVKKLQYMSEEEKKEAMEEMTELKNKYAICIERPQVAPKPVAPFDPCEEKKILESSLSALQEKLNYVTSLYEKGNVSQEEYLKYKIELENYKKRLESAEKRCEGKEVKESPCLKVDTLKKIYSNLKMKLGATVDEGERKLIEEKINSIAKDIEDAIEECKKETNVEEVTSITEIQKAIETKTNVIVAEGIEKNKSKEELLKELEKIEEEKNRLIKEFTQKMRELDARKQSIIEKISIGKKVIANNIEVEATKVKLEVGGKEIEVIPGEKVEIKQENVNVKSSPIDFINGSIISSKSGKEIKILPAQLKEKIKEKEEIKEAKIEDVEKPIYEVSTEKSGKILWIIPITMKIDYKIDATNGNVIEEKRPWFEIFVK
ncbi:MAG: hypothetical protein QXI58_03100, partial [Candidatus Micrarchaeia archaeon]